MNWYLLQLFYILRWQICKAELYIMFTCRIRIRIRSKKDWIISTAAALLSISWQNGKWMMALLEEVTTLAEPELHNRMERIL